MTIVKMPLSSQPLWELPCSRVTSTPVSNGASFLQHTHLYYPHNYTLAFSDYFKLFGLQLAITTVRQMLETAYFDAMQKNVISYNEYLEVSVANANVCLDWFMLCFCCFLLSQGMPQARPFPDNGEELL